MTANELAQLQQAAALLNNLIAGNAGQSPTPPPTTSVVGTIVGMIDKPVQLYIDGKQLVIQQADGTIQSPMPWFTSATLAANPKLAVGNHVALVYVPGGGTPSTPTVNCDALVSVS